ncbi:response regulator [Chryseobacterium taklimakanense]|uniref:Transcriptional regulatory protein YycF n=1 Tax=Chryseobacterium taklimakanense TaxID=536441 RepID=A0A239XIE8_9FLAO|nr:response regulator [Chryseobacterium taklimakanense]SNV46023.1 Transcriptional regulatory protein YycF [Chryseobacterium taklimakanense]
MSIIIVDDNADICGIVEYLLVTEGYKVRACTNPINIFEMVKQQKPKLIITDMMMSGLDGRDLVKKIKGDPKTSDIKIVMMSAIPNAEKMGKETGADDYIAKPFDSGDLLQKVKVFFP